MNERHVDANGNVVFGASGFAGLPAAITYPEYVQTFKLASPFVQISGDGVEPATCYIRVDTYITGTLTSRLLPIFREWLELPA